MICRVHILLPYFVELVVPKETILRPIDYEEFPYYISIHPLKQAPKDFQEIERKSVFDLKLLKPTEAPIEDKSFLIDGSPVVRLNLLQIDLRKETFDRSNPSSDIKQTLTDPSLEYIFSVANNFLSKLAIVCTSPFVKKLNPDYAYYHGMYLNDDETELPLDPSRIRGFFSAPKRITYSIVDETAWENIKCILPNYSPYIWETLLLNAQALLPDIGPAIVLAWTALETMIGDVNDDLASRANLPGSLWKWITDRNDYRKEPSVDEQFTTLLEVFSGKSLKNQARLWEGYKQLKDARNTFVHEGHVAIRKGKQVITSQEAQELIKIANEIVMWVENETGTALRRPALSPLNEHKIHIHRML